MTDESLDDARRKTVARRARVVSWSLALPILGVTVSALAGLGLTRGLPPVVAFVVGLALTLLPAAGLARFRLGGVSGPALATACWCLAVLIGLPSYFPGERAEATSLGLRAIWAGAGPDFASSVGRIGASIVDRLGADPAPAKASAAEPARIAAAAAHSPRRRPAARASGDESRLPTPMVVLSYEGDHASLRIQVDVDGPAVGEQVEMLFDTGATLTTLDRATLDRIGITIPTDAPWVSLRTANGEIEAPLVLVDAIWLGDEPVEWVTVAVCDGCTDAPAVGLLGLNTSQRFHISLDHDRRRIELTRRERADDRTLDIGQWLQIRSRATRQWTGSVDVALTATNRAHRRIAEAVVDLSCGDQVFAVQIDDIPAEGERTTEISLPRGTDCSRQKVELARAHWLLDRF
jgi:clan AA aspartic protease (TIGR02281 family)